MGVRNCSWKRDIKSRWNIQCYDKDESITLFSDSVNGYTCFKLSEKEIKQKGKENYRAIFSKFVPHAECDKLYRQRSQSWSNIRRHKVVAVLSHVSLLFLFLLRQISWEKVAQNDNSLTFDHFSLTIMHRLQSVQSTSIRPLRLQLPSRYTSAVKI